VPWSFVVMEQGYYLEDIEPGMSAVFGKTITDADILMFSGVSGDTNPVHMNEEFASATPFKGRIAHGMLTASLISTVLGTKLPGPGCIYVSQSMKFLAPVRERKRVTLETVCEVSGNQVLTGTAVLMVPRRPRDLPAAA
jgi:3-hydroxybutyryl-CoA dehydratase